MNQCILLGFVLAGLLGSFARAETPLAALQAGFAEADITPVLGKQPVYMAGFGQNRRATTVHDPLKVRVVVLRHGHQKIALASADLIGLFYDSVQRIRERLPGYAYVLVSCTHNHDGPDTLGLWGSHPFASGVDPEYLKTVEDRIVRAVQTAEANLCTVRAIIGTAGAPELLHDAREPFVKHDDLVALQFFDAKTAKPAGVVVQWNCHPETMDGKNTSLSADFVATSVDYLRKRFQCPVLYLTGTVGGLMTSLSVPIRGDQGKELSDGTFAKTERYGRRIGSLAESALAKAEPISLTPFAVRSRIVYLPLHNKLYAMARQLGVLKREAFAWAGNLYEARPADAQAPNAPLCLQTEIAWLRLGDLDIAAIPGEIYPELVLGKIQHPPDPSADFPDAPKEPAIYDQLRGPYRMLVGLANDEIGYIIPKRQWDEKPPFCYGRSKSQYGEVNSLGPETAPLLCRAFRDLAQVKKR